MAMPVLTVWALFAAIVALIAHGRGRSPAAWFLYGILIWPVALIHILVLPPDRRALDARALRRGDARRCPHCAELVRPEARICRHCGRALATPVLSVVPPPRPTMDTEGRPLAPCPNCLTSIPADSERCPECRYPVRAA